nr:hypothetical protein M7.6 - Caenorhabditis elegans [Caenorhabditis elegans]
MQSFFMFWKPTYLLFKKVCHEVSKFGKIRTESNKFILANKFVPISNIFDFRLREVCNKNNVTIQTFPETQSISIVGPPSGVLNKILKGLSSVTVQFDCNMMDIHYPVQQLEQERGIQVTCKRKNGDIMTITMKSTESKLAEVLQSRELLLALPPTTYSSPDDYDPNPVMSRPPSLTPLQTEMASGVRVFLTPPIESPKSPDPEDSPLAASILKGAKDISKNR